MTAPRHRLGPTLRETFLLVVAACSVVLLGLLGACGNDDDPTLGPVVVTVTTIPASSVVPSVLPSDTTDIPLPSAPPGTADLPPAPPVSSDVPIVITAVVGSGTGPDTIERVLLGSVVTITITNPASADEFHLHGYDLGDGQEFEAGQAASFTFTADRVGTFELESHETSQVLLVVEVV